MSRKSQSYNEELSKDLDAQGTSTFSLFGIPELNNMLNSEQKPKQKLCKSYSDEDYQSTKSIDIKKHMFKSFSTDDCELTKLNGELMTACSNNDTDRVILLLKMNRPLNYGQALSLIHI